MMRIKELAAKRGRGRIGIAFSRSGRKCWLVETPINDWLGKRITPKLTKREIDVWINEELTKGGA